MAVLDEKVNNLVAKVEEPNAVATKRMAGQSPARRAVASPKRSAFTSMRSMSERYRLHNLRSPSARPVKSSTRPVSSVPAMPPTRSTGNRVESCLLPDHMLERKSKAGVIEHRVLALGHRRQAAGEIGELADVISRHSLIRFRLVVVRGRMMSRPHVEERIKQPGEVAAQQQGGDPGLVGLKRQRDDVAHEPHVLADVFRQAVVGSWHRQCAATAILGASVGFRLSRHGCGGSVARPPAHW